MPVSNPKVRWSGRARVTRRIVSDPDHRGRQNLVAREGEVVSVREAVRREIPEDALEPVGPGGKVALARYSEATSDPEALSEVEEAARQAERASQQTSDAARSARARGDQPAGEYPKDLGGGHWELSDGTVTDADTSRGDAEQAEADLAGGGPPDGTKADVHAWVDGDPQRAAVALEAEQAKGDDARVTLIDELEAVADGGGE